VVCRVQDKAHVSVKKTTLLQEIETVGEQVLRDKLIDTYVQKEKDKADSNIPKTEEELFGIKRSKVRQAATSTHLPSGTAKPTADDLVRLTTADTVMIAS
jgi:hypothetical protein